MKALKHFFLKRRHNRNKNPRILSAVLADSLTYLGEDALSDLHRQVVRLEYEGVEGILVEAGCALGGSAIVLANAKSPSRPLYVYDVFGMIPPPSTHDGTDVHNRYEIIKSGQSVGINKEKYYGYEENLYEKVVDNFRRYNLPIEKNNIHLVKGLFQDTLYVQGKVALAHIDVDWYESTKTCLERMEPHLISGGVLVVDDYDHWSGCKKAVDEYFSDKRNQYEFIRRSRFNIIRK
jgi:predicted O-methyltransferase YrrM